MLNSRFQKADESFDQFLAVLRKLAATCEFCTFEDDLLRDRIVTSLGDHGHRERLLRVSTLTLQKVIDICRTNEMAASRDTNWRNLVHSPHSRKEETWSTREPTKTFTSHARANIVVTLIQPETATLMAKRAQNATRKIT